MTSFLLLLSFLLHLVVIIVLIQLVQHIQKLKNNQHEQIQLIIEEFTEEIRQQNEKLERNLTNDPIRSQKSFQNSMNEAIEQLNELQLDIEQPPQEQVVHSNDTPKLEELESPFEQIDKEDLLETSFESRVMQLASEGKTISEIAKILNRGKTEIELLLKLHNFDNEEAST